MKSPKSKLVLFKKKYFPKKIILKKNKSFLILFAALIVVAYQNCQRGFSTNNNSNGLQSNTSATLGNTFISAANSSSVVKNDLAQKPYMGFNTYYSNRIQQWQMNKQNITQISDDMQSNGLVSSGYNVLSLDIGWWYAWSGSPRDTATHKIIPAPLFGSESDMSAMISHIHSNGLKVGLYTDTGSGEAAGCGGYPGSGEYILQDVLQMISWGVDMLKVDHCGGNSNATKAGISTAYNGSDYEYGLWSHAVISAAQTTGKQLLLNIADWNFVDRTSSWASELGNSWRTQSDIDWRSYNLVNGSYVYDPAASAPISWSLIMRNFTGNDVPPAAGPGHWNDPDYLLIGGFGLNATEEQSYFNMWVIQSAPLILATYPADLSPSASDGPRLRAMLLNPEVIAIDQDSLGRQGEKVREDLPGQVVYAKALSGSGEHAVLLLNENDVVAASISVNWGDLGLTNSSAAKVRDVVNRKDLGSFSGSFTVTNIPAHGSRLLLIQGTDASINNGSWQSLSKKILGSPAVVVHAGVETDVALGLDRYYWSRSKTGSSVTDWTRINPAGCSDKVIFFNDPAITYVNGAIDIVGLGYVDAWGAGPQSVEVFNSYSYDNGKTWVCYGNLGKPSGSMLHDRLALVTPDGSTLDVLGRTSDNTISSKRWTSSGGWSSWQNDGACVRSGLSASSRPNGVIDIAAIGCDNNVWHGWYTTPGTVYWESVAASQNSFINTPSSVWVEASQQYNIFATTTASHDVQTISWNSISGWGSWSSLGGCLKGSVAASGILPVTLLGTACNTPGTNADTDVIGDTPVTRLFTPPALSGSSSGSSVACSFNNQSVASGKTVTAYQDSSVPYGSTCSSQIRSCSNGILSGSFTNASCTVAVAPVVTPLMKAEGYIIPFYTNLINRTPLSSEVDYYYAQPLIAGSTTCLQAALSFINSAEFSSSNSATFSNGKFVTALYLSFLGRQPDTSGYNYWVGQMTTNSSNGMSLLQNQIAIATAFSSPTSGTEFQDRCNTLGFH